MIIDARGASITYGELGGVVCLSVSFGGMFSMVWGYVFEGADFEKSGPESIRKLLDPESES